MDDKWSDMYQHLHEHTHEKQSKRYLPSDVHLTNLLTRKKFSVQKTMMQTAKPPKEYLQVLVLP